MRENKSPRGNSVPRTADIAKTKERLARVERSIVDVEADGRPMQIKQALLAALRKERDVLKAHLIHPSGQTESPAG